MTEYNKFAWHKAVLQSKLSPADQGILHGMGTYSNRYGLNVCVSQQTIANYLGCSVKTVERAVKKAIEAELLEKTRSAVNRGSNPGPAEYRLIIPSRWWSEEQRPGTPFYPGTRTIDPTPVSVESWIEPTPMSGENWIDQTSVSDETDPFEVSTDIWDESTRQMEPTEQTNEADSTDTHVALTVFNSSLTEKREHSVPNGTGAAPLRSADAGRPPVQHPLMQGVPRPQEEIPRLGVGQPRLFLEAKLGRGLYNAEEDIAAAMHAKGKSRASILLAVQSLRMPA